MLRQSGRRERPRFVPADGILEPVVAPENLTTGDERRRAEDTELARLVGRGIVGAADVVGLGEPEDAGGIVTDHGCGFSTRPPYPITELDLANRIALVGAAEGWCADYMRATYRHWFGEGVTEFDRYRVDPTQPLAPDFFVPEGAPPPGVSLKPTP